VLRQLEEKIAGLVEGAFSRAFRSEVRPVEIARKLAREMDRNRRVSLSRTYAPSEYVVHLSTADRRRLAAYEGGMVAELAAYLLEHARRERLELLARPVIELRTDERLSLGEFGIEALPSEIGDATGSLRPAISGGWARLSVGDRTVALPAAGVTIGRATDCDVVLDDPGVSRRHAALRPAAGGWVIEDLGSTNGVLVNGRRVGEPRALAPGDRIELGAILLTFELG